MAARVPGVSALSDLRSGAQAATSKLNMGQKYILRCLWVQDTNFTRGLTRAHERGTEYKSAAQLNRHC